MSLSNSQVQDPGRVNDTHLHGGQKYVLKNNTMYARFDDGVHSMALMGAPSMIRALDLQPARLTRSSPHDSGKSSAGTMMEKEMANTQADVKGISLIMR